MKTQINKFYVFGYHGVASDFAFGWEANKVDGGARSRVEEPAGGSPFPGCWSCEEPAGGSPFPGCWSCEEPAGGSQ